MPVRVLGSQAGGRPLGFSPPPHSTSVLSSPHLRADRQHHWAPADMTNNARLWNRVAGLAALIFLYWWAVPLPRGAGGGAPLLLQPQTPALWLCDAWLMVHRWGWGSSPHAQPAPFLHAEASLSLLSLPSVLSFSFAVLASSRTWEVPRE